MRTGTRSALAWWLGVLLAACAPGEAHHPASAEPPPRVTLTVFAAASLAEAFAEVGQDFEARQLGVEVVLSLAGSQQLAQQLLHGAPADVFASANARQMDAAIEAGRVARDAPQVFATNTLVVVMPEANPAGLNTLGDLVRPGLRLVLADEAVPAGAYARVFLSHASRDAAFGSEYARKVLANVVSFEQNVRAVLAKVRLGEADAGIVYAADVAGDQDTGVRRIDIPAALNVVARYPIAVAADSPHAPLAHAFVDFVRAPDGQQILARHGFAPSDAY